MSAEGLAGRASAIMLDYTQQGVAVRTMIDGVWIPREASRTRDGDPALESLKLLCGLNPQDRQSRQQGIFAAEYDSVALCGRVRFAGHAWRRAGAAAIRGQEGPASRRSTSWA